jgi:hypothetical protein
LTADLSTAVNAGSQPRGSELSEAQFYSTQSPLTVGEIVVLTGAEPRAETDLGVRADHRARVDRHALAEARAGGWTAL